MLGQRSDRLHQSEKLVRLVFIFLSKIRRNRLSIVFRIKVGEILGNVNTPKIHSMYAKARESEGRYKEACAAYLKAGEWENAIRYVEHFEID